MASKEKNKSLLEIAVELFREKHDKYGIKKGQPIIQIAKEVMEIKGLKTSAGKELLPQFLADFMESGYFVYCGDGCWDLKEYQEVAVLEKEVSDTYERENNDEVQRNELRSDYDTDTQSGTIYQSNESEEEEEDEKDKEKDDLDDLLDYEGEEDENVLTNSVNLDDEEYNEELLTEEELDEITDDNQ